jgi:threonine synthase
MDYYLECVENGCRFPSSYNKQICGNCGSILEVIYKGKAKVPASHEFWDYEALLPKGKYKHYSLGGTKLVQSAECNNLFLKLELYNPTRSFKDRGSVVEIAKALEYGYDEISVASTGNMAYSLAYYAKIAGFKATVFIGKAANPDKIRNILMTHDATLHMVTGDFSKAQAMAAKYAEKSSAFLAGDYCYRKEGQKTVAYEIATQLNGLTHIIVPVGNATLISGMVKALKEMKMNGVKIIAVQAEKCSPLVKAFRSKKMMKYERPGTKADAIAVGLPTFGDQALKAINDTGGTAITVTESEMEKEQSYLYKSQGILAELAGVASIAAFKKLKFKQNDRVAAIISGGNI